MPTRAASSPRIATTLAPVSNIIGTCVPFTMVSKAKPPSRPRSAIASFRLAETLGVCTLGKVGTLDVIETLGVIDTLARIGTLAGTGTLGGMGTLAGIGAAEC